MGYTTITGNSRSAATATANGYRERERDRGISSSSNGDDNGSRTDSFSNAFRKKTTKKVSPAAAAAAAVDRGQRQRNQNEEEKVDESNESNEKEILYEQLIKELECKLQQSTTETKTLQTQNHILHQECNSYTSRIQNLEYQCISRSEKVKQLSDCIQAKRNNKVQEKLIEKSLQVVDLIEQNEKYKIQNESLQKGKRDNSKLLLDMSNIIRSFNSIHIQYMPTSGPSSSMPTTSPPSPSVGSSCTSSSSSSLSRDSIYFDDSNSNSNHLVVGTGTGTGGRRQCQPQPQPQDGPLENVRRKIIAIEKSIQSVNQLKDDTIMQKQEIVLLEDNNANLKEQIASLKVQAKHAQAQHAQTLAQAQAQAQAQFQAQAEAQAQQRSVSYEEFVVSEDDGDTDTRTSCSSYYEEEELLLEDEDEEESLTTIFEEEEVVDEDNDHEHRQLFSRLNKTLTPVDEEGGSNSSLIIIDPNAHEQLQSNFSKALDVIQLLKEDLKQHSLNSKDYLHKEDILKNQIDSSIQESSNLKVELGQLKGKYKLMRENHQELTRTDYDDESDQRTKTLLEVSTMNTVLRKQYNDLEKEYTMKINTLQKQVQEYRSNLKLSKKEYSTKINELEFKLKKSNSKLTVIENINSDRTNTIVTTHKKDQESITKKYQNLKYEYDTFLEIHLKMEEDYEQSKQYYKESILKIKTFESTIQTLNSKYDTNILSHKDELIQKDTIINDWKNNKYRQLQNDYKSIVSKKNELKQQSCNDKQQLQKEHQQLILKLNQTIKNSTLKYQKLSYDYDMKLMNYGKSKQISIQTAIEKIRQEYELKIKENDSIKDKLLSEMYCSYQSSLRKIESLLLVEQEQRSRSALSLSLSSSVAQHDDDNNSNGVSNNNEEGKQLVVYQEEEKDEQIDQVGTTTTKTVMERIKLFEKQGGMIALLHNNNNSTTLGNTSSSESNHHQKSSPDLIFLRDFEMIVQKIGYYDYVKNNNDSSFLPSVVVPSVDSSPPTSRAGDGDGNGNGNVIPSLTSSLKLTSSSSSFTTTNDIRKRTAIQQAKRSAIVEAIFKRVDEHAFKMNNDTNTDADADIVTSAITATTAPITATANDYFDLLHHFIRLNEVNHDAIRFSRFNSKSATTTTTTTSSSSSSSSSKSTSREMKGNNSRRHQIEKNLRLLELKYKNLREGYQSPKKSSTNTTTTNDKKGEYDSKSEEDGNSCGQPSVAVSSVTQPAMRGGDGGVDEMDYLKKKNLEKERELLEQKSLVHEARKQKVVMGNNSLKTVISELRDVEDSSESGGGHLWDIMSISAQREEGMGYDERQVVDEMPSFDIYHLTPPPADTSDDEEVDHTTLDDHDPISSTTSLEHRDEKASRDSISATTDTETAEQSDCHPIGIDVGKNTDNNGHYHPTAGSINEIQLELRQAKEAAEISRRKQLEREEDLRDVILQYRELQKENKALASVVFDNADQTSGDIPASKNQRPLNNGGRIGKSQKRIGPPSSTVHQDPSRSQSIQNPAIQQQQQHQHQHQHQHQQQQQQSLKIRELCDTHRGVSSQLIERRPQMQQQKQHHQHQYQHHHQSPSKTLNMTTRPNSGNGNMKKKSSTISLKSTIKNHSISTKSKRGGIQQPQPHQQQHQQQPPPTAKINTNRKKFGIFRGFGFTKN